MKATNRVIILLLCVITMATILCSCSKEDSYQRRIVGKWGFIHETTYFYDALNTLVKTNENTDFAGMVVEFTANGNYIALGFSSYYILDGDLLILGEGNTVTIEEMTNTTMIWSERRSWLEGETYKIIKTEFKKLSD